MTNEQKRLPDTLWELLKVAVDDCQKVERKPQYKLNMFKWHNPGGSEKRPICTVCMAGSVMACSLGAKPTTYLEPNSFDFSTNEKLDAINDMRDGFFESAYVRVYGEEPGSFQRLAMAEATRAIGASYSNRTGRAEWKDYRRAQRILASENL